MSILHFGIPDIIQCDNGTEFKKKVIFLLAWYKISISLMINHKQHVLKTLLEQGNCTIKNKLSHKIEVIRNFERSEDSICLILTMNTQAYSSLLYKMTLYEGLFVASIEIRVIIQQSLLKSALGLLTVQMNQWTMLCKMDFSSLMK